MNTAIRDHQISLEHTSPDQTGLAGTGLVGDNDVHIWRLRPDDAGPLFISCALDELRQPGAFTDWVAENRPALDRLLLNHGAIIFRGFAIADTDQFHQFVDLYDCFEGDYRGGATTRDAVKGKVYEATRIDHDAKLPLHQEMAYLQTGPGRLAFFCRKPAEQGGATTIADMRQVTAQLPEWLRSRLEAEGILAIRNFAPPLKEGEEMGLGHADMRPWQAAFYTDDPAVVEEACRAKDMEPIWNDDGSLTVRNRMAAFATHPQTGEQIYRNTLHTNAARDMYNHLPADRKAKLEAMFARQKTPTGFYLGDGSALPPDQMRDLQALFDAQERHWQWEAGDIMLVDNLLTAHGRLPYEGTRDVQVALLA